MFILLIGPMGSGKSHVGRVLERRLGVHFLHVEPHWLADHDQCTRAGRPPVIAEGIARFHPLIAQALQPHRPACVDTTAASAEILSDLRALAAVCPVPSVRGVADTARGDRLASAVAAWQGNVAA